MNNFAVDLPIHSVATLGFYFTLIIYIIFTAILYYHWKEYSAENSISKITTIAYLATTLPLVAAMGLSTLLI